jgi:hypothetical protein
MDDAIVYRNINPEEGIFSRILDHKNYNDTLDYNKYDRKSFIKCHWGQRKLLFSEIEFLTIAKKYINFENALCIYVGAASGTHLPIIGELFKNLKFLLYDPNPFDIKEDKQFMIKTGKDGFFTDDKINDVLTIANGRDIIFISDIRIKPNNEDCHKDMLAQQRWSILLNAKAIELKFRLPYVDVDEKGNEINNLLNLTIPDDVIKDKIILPDTEKSKYSYLYLDGDIYWQLYPHEFSTETRLITIRLGDKFKMKYYDYKKYESQCLYFNEIDRLKTFFIDDSHFVKYNILGYDDGYDSVSEYFIIKQYLESKNINEIIKLIYHIDKTLRYLTNTNLILATIKTMRKYYDKRKTEIYNKYKNDKKSISEKLKQLEIIKTQSYSYKLIIKRSYQNQINKFLIVNVLTRKDYNEQRYSYKDSIK